MKSWSCSKWRGAAHNLGRTKSSVDDTCVFDATGPPPRAPATLARPRRGPSAGDPYSRARRTVLWPRRPFLPPIAWSSEWRYDRDGGHVRGMDVFKMHDGEITEKLSCVKGWPSPLPYEKRKSAAKAGAQTRKEQGP